MHCGDIVCEAGYTGDGIDCTDIDECALFQPCDVHAVCENTIGSFICTCNPGYSGV
jgi:hypothetical protein